MAEPQDMTSALNKPDAGTTTREARVLLVDDDRELCQMLGEYLTAEHFEVRSVHDGSDALAELESNDFEILILDVMLPSVSGFDVLLKLGANPAMMSGSGSSFFAIFDDQTQVTRAIKSFRKEAVFPVSLVSRTRYRASWRRWLSAHRIQSEWPPRSRYAQ